uniref:MAK10-like protein n=1 Tax=Tanacetum cinerariifolium TaxID=118510 RepID=A0A6L2MSM4_TANCI|nr:MAK10-like protein [Tanacetum cinerariifolium]
MENKNPIRTLRDYSKPSHEGYRNTIELLNGKNVVPLRSDTIRLVQNGSSFHELRSEDPNQHLKNFLKLVDSLDLDVANRERTRLRLFQFAIRDPATRDVKIVPFKDVIVFRRMVEFLGAIPINLKRNMYESEDLIKSPINWDKPPKNKDGAWHSKIRLIDPDGEEFTKTLQSVPTSRKLSEI